MRLITIILIGLLCIAATYFYTSSSQGQQLPQTSANTNSSSKLKEGKAAPAQNSKPTNSAATAQPNSPAQASSQVPAPLKDNEIPLEQARIQARSAVGKTDPFAPLTDLKPFPGSYAPPAQTSQDSSAPGAGGSSKSKGHAKKESDMVPPPPPTAGASLNGAEMPSGLAFGDLPMPPERQGIAGKITLVGIVGDQCIFNVTDLPARRQHHWPKTFSLSRGESFEQMRLLEIHEDNAVVEEGGERITKSLPAVR